MSQSFKQRGKSEGRRYTLEKDPKKKDPTVLLILIKSANVYCPRDKKIFRPMTPPICFVMSLTPKTKEELEFQYLTYAVYKHNVSAGTKNDESSFATTGDKVLTDCSLVKITKI
jgi:hypothetical protein